MKLSIFPFLACLVLSCSTPKYILKTTSDLASMDLENSGINYIPIKIEDLFKSRILDSTYYLISLKKYGALSKYIKTLEANNSSDRALSQTLLLISKKKYSQAAISLKEVEDKNYPLLKELLSTDMDYELSRTTGNQDYKSLLTRYQNVIDHFPDDIPLKKIVAIRLRYLRYNY